MQRKASRNMGSQGSSSSSSSVLLFLALLVVLNTAGFCNGGKTSPYVRKKYPLVDMPFDADVFDAPPGHNAPQQVDFHFTDSFVFLCPIPR